ncbi:hypothetical protein DdX_21576 [Ditylenchus destructor]|uniref:Uncharacterized protein n=1 Tax=Ditylenchus destructor TaxID=166010 RepID=A0AAD4MFL6_9BILA|nr:hypothetical protein DdX_21576 [Ditylenchus destructor]
MAGNRNESSTRLAEDEKNELFKMLAQSKDGFYDRGNNDFKSNLTHLQIGKGNSSGNGDDIAFNVHGSLTLNGSIPVIPGLLKIEVSAKADGDYAQRQYDASLEKHGRGYVDHLEAKNDIKRQNVTQYNVTNRIQERIANALSSNRRFNDSSEAQNSSSSGTTEVHTVRNIVRWPDVLRKAQLHLVCLGIDIPLNATEDFSTNAEVLLKINEKERAVGYPDSSVYASCP